jgi:hypothetical protein
MQFSLFTSHFAPFSRLLLAQREKMVTLRSQTGRKFAKRPRVLRQACA